MTPEPITWICLKSPPKKILPKYTNTITTAVSFQRFFIYFPLELEIHRKSPQLGFQIPFHGCTHQFSMDSPRFPWIFHGFPLVFPWKSHGFSASNPTLPGRPARSGVRMGSTDSGKLKTDKKELGPGSC